MDNFGRYGILLIDSGYIQRKGDPISGDSFFVKIQKKLKDVIKILLTLSVIFLGGKIAMGEEINKKLNLSIKNILSSSVVKPMIDLNKQSVEKVIDTLNDDLCKEIKITKHHSGDITLNLTFEADVKNEHAKEVRRILGLKQYEKIELVYRNEKHLIINN